MNKCVELNGIKFIGGNIEDTPNPLKGGVALI